MGKIKKGYRPEWAKEFNNTPNRYVYSIYERDTGDIIYIGKTNYHHKRKDRVRNHFTIVNGTNGTCLPKTMHPDDRYNKYWFSVLADCESLDDLEIDILEGYLINKHKPAKNDVFKDIKSFTSKIIISIILFKLKLKQL